MLHYLSMFCIIFVTPRLTLEKSGRLDVCICFKDPYLGIFGHRSALWGTSSRRHFDEASGYLYRFCPYVTHLDWAASGLNLPEPELSTGNQAAACLALLLGREDTVCARQRGLITHISGKDHHR